MAYLGSVSLAGRESVMTCYFGNHMEKVFDKLTTDELRDLVEIYARNIYALDGFWFQSVETDRGMDEAMHHDREVWKRFTRTEALRIRKFLGLGEKPGLDGLVKALSIRFSALANPSVDILRDGNTLIYKVNECRVQSARKSKGMPYHPCSSVGIIEHAGFASVIDERITTEMVSCYPEVSDRSCACCWRFTLKD